MSKEYIFQGVSVQGVSVRGYLFKLIGYVASISPQYTFIGLVIMLVLGFIFQGGRGGGGDLFRGICSFRV